LENPFAEEWRTRLLAALVEADARLREHSAAPRAEDASLDIPDLGARPPELREVRELLDEVDRDLVALLPRRAQLARGGGRVKAALGHGVIDSAREAKLFAARRAWAAELGLDPDSVGEIFEAILRFSRRLEKEDRE